MTGPGLISCGSPAAPGSCDAALTPTQARAVERRRRIIRAVRAGRLSVDIAQEHGIAQSTLSSMLVHLRARTTALDALAMRLEGGRTLPMVAFVMVRGRLGGVRLRPVDEVRT